MTHAVHCFLINADPENLESIGDVNEYLNDRTDENNWYQELVIVHQNGEIRQLCPNKDWRGRDNWYEEYEKIPAQERWAEVLKLANDVVRYEVSSAAQTVLSDYDYVVPGVMDYSEMPDYFRTVVVEASQKNTSKDMFWYGIRHIASIVSQIRGIEDMPPFTTSYEDPYSSIRAVDLRGYISGEMDKDNLAVVLVDIHT